MSLQLTFDMKTGCGIYMVTSSAESRRESQGAATARQQTLEDRSTSRRGHPQPDAREGPRSKVPRGGILRSARCRAGQVRDAAPRFEGQRIGERCRRRIRGLKADILPSQGELRGGRHRRAGTKEARPTRAAQASWRRVGIPPGPARPRRTNPCARAGSVDTAGIRPRCASKDDRACDQWKKNIALVAKTAAECSPRLPTIVAEYEILRMSTLGDALLPESRSGLVLFLRRGMWGWAQTFAATSSRPTPLVAMPLHPMELCSRSTIIQVLAAIVMNADSWGTPRTSR